MHGFTDYIPFMAVNPYQTGDRLVLVHLVHFIVSRYTFSVGTIEV